MAKTTQKPVLQTSSQQTAPPQSPPITDFWKWVVFHLANDWPTLKKAPLGLIAVLLSLGFIAWAVVTYAVLPYKDSVLGSKDGIIALKDERIRSLEEKNTELEKKAATTLNNTATAQVSKQAAGHLSPEARARVTAKLKLANYGKMRIHVQSKLADERSARLAAIVTDAFSDAGFDIVAHPPGSGIDAFETFAGIRAAAKDRLTPQLYAAFIQLCAETGEMDSTITLDGMGEGEVAIQIGVVQ